MMSYWTPSDTSDNGCLRHSFTSSPSFLIPMKIKIKLTLKQYGDFFIRPCIKKKSVEQLINELETDSVGGLLATKIVDTLKKSTKNEFKTVDRANLYAAQTPQMYRFKHLKKALEQTIKNNAAITDETQAIEQINLMPKIVIGSKENIKITYPEDLKLANFFLQ